MAAQASRTRLLSILVGHMQGDIDRGAKCSSQCDAQRELIKRHSKSYPYRNTYADSGSGIGPSGPGFLIRICRHALLLLGVLMRGEAPKHMT